MLHFRIILRSLRKNLIYTWTNILGLAIAFCFVFLTSVYLIHEYTFDQSYPESEKIHRLVTVGSDMANSMNAHAYIFSEGFKETYPQMESVVRAYSNPYVSDLVRVKDNPENAFAESDFWYVEKEFMKMFDVQTLSGGFETLNVPGTIIISESVSKKLFKSEEVVGRKIIIDQDEFEVIGVFKDFPSNASLDPRFIISFETMKSKERYQAYFESSGYLMFKVYLTLVPGTDVENIEKAISKSSGGGEIRHGAINFALEPLKEYHFSSLDLARYFRPKADQQLVVWLAIISLCLLGVAMANFGNISLAVALGSSKEVAIKKVIGANRNHIIRNSLYQTLLLSLISFVGALILIEALLPFYSDFVDRELSTSSFGIWGYLILLIFSCLIGLIAGIYPSLIISNFKVSRLFNSFGARNASTSMVRKGLLAFQFLIAFGLIATMLFMNRQLEFMLNKEPGYNYDNTLVLVSNWFQGRDESKIQTFKDQLMAMPEILDIALSDEHPMKAFDAGELRKAGFKDGWEKIDLLKIGIDCNFLDFYGISSSYDPEVISLFCTDGKVGLLNETALKTLENEPIGKRMPESYGTAKPGYIIQEGMVEDVHFNSVRESISPMLFRPLSHSNGRANFSIRYAETAELGKLVQVLQEMWWGYEPTEPFVLKDLEEEHQKLYSSELKMMSMTSILGVGVCIIAFAGIFAMSIYYGRERLKEISIRKVLGAGIYQLFGLQNRIYFLLMLISFSLAMPIVVMVVNSWFSQFAYRTDQPWWLFVLAGAIMICSTLLSTAWYSLKVAKLNPSDILRDS